ncbi:hypothetical protein [Botrimarina colliarenosi]|nr:hypothetical protein [Botrimarina colliarenosi]
MTPIPLTRVVDKYVAERRLSAARTVRFLRAITTRLSEHLGREPTTDDFTIEVARRWLAARAETVGRATVIDDAKRFLTLWRWCASQGWVEGTYITPKHLYPKELRRYRLEGPPVRHAIPLRKRAPSVRKPRGKAPPRPDRHWLGRLLG